MKGERVWVIRDERRRLTFGNLISIQGLHRRWPWLHDAISDRYKSGFHFKKREHVYKKGAKSVMYFFIFFKFNYQNYHYFFF